MKKRICPIHGLYIKQDDSSGCPQCKKINTKKYDEKKRNKETDKFYHSRAWKRVRGLQLSKFPLCKICGKPAKIVDHIVEIKDGGAKLSLNNLQSLCISCHNSKTKTEKAKREGGFKSYECIDLDTEAPVNFLQSPDLRGRVK